MKNEFMYILFNMKHEYTYMLFNMKNEYAYIRVYMYILSSNFSIQRKIICDLNA